MNFRTLLIRPNSAHVLLMAFFMSIAAALVFGLEQTLKSAEDSIKQSLLVSVFMQSSLSDEQAQKWGSQLQTKDSEIQNVNFISKDQALQEAQKDPSLARSLMILKENPLPSTFVLRYSDRAWLERDELATLLKSLPEIQEIRWDSQSRSVFRSLHQWRAWLIRFSAFSGVLLIVWAFMGIYQFLALRASLTEFAIQLLIGAVGGSIALALWGYTLQGLGPDAGVFRPSWFSMIPMLTGLVVAIGCFGWSHHEEK